MGAPRRIMGKCTKKIQLCGYKHIVAEMVIVAIKGTIAMKNKHCRRNSEPQIQMSIEALNHHKIS